MFIHFILLVLLSSFTTIIQCQINTKQSTCFKDISIYQSNSPHVIQKNGDSICVNYERNINTDNANYEKMINTKIDSSILSRSINLDNSVSSPVGTAINLSIYEAGTSVFRYISSVNTSTYYTLPVKLFNSQTCSGLQPITYLNDFTSTCNQLVNQQTCGNELDPTQYLTNSFCLITQPSNLAGTNPATTCCGQAGSSAVWTATSTCTNALQNLNLIIYYSNPSGIVNCSVSFNTTTGTSTSPVMQTFTVNFLKVGLSLPNTLRSGNPGYIPGDPIIAGNSNGNSITIISGLSIIQASPTGGCAGTNPKVISFGQNVQSTCLFTPTTAGSCPDINTASTIFMPYNINNLYVAGKGSSDPTNTSDSWLSITFCTSQIGSTSGSVCQTSSLPSSSTGQCYIRLDVQIAFANFGSVTNPQPILGAVVYHFQSVSQNTITTTTTFLMTQTVTFQDVSNLPVTQGDQLPRPNVRLPGDFFYPFSLNRAATPIAFSSVFYLLIFFLFFLSCSSI